MFLRIDTTLPPFYVLVYLNELILATADTEALALVKAELQERHTYTALGELHNYLGLQITRERARHTITLTQSHMVHQVLQCFGFQYSSPQPTPLSTSHSLSAPPYDESVEPSGLYLELVGYLMYLMICTRPDLAYPLSLLACYMAPGRHRKVHFDAAKSVLRYLCSTSGMGLVLGGRGSVALIGHSDASWADNQATQRSSQGYTFSLGFASVSWSLLTYLLTDLGERPHSPPVLPRAAPAAPGAAPCGTLAAPAAPPAAPSPLAAPCCPLAACLRPACRPLAALVPASRPAFPPCCPTGRAPPSLPALTSLPRSSGSGDGGGGSSGSGAEVTVELFGGEFLAVARCNCSGVSTSPLHPSSYVSGMLVRVVAVAVVAVAHGASRSSTRCAYVIRTEFGAAAELPSWLELLRQGVDIFPLDYDAILTAMNALPTGTEGDCSLCVLPDPGIESAALGASESSLLGTGPAEALHTFTLDPGASRCFFRDITTLTRLSAPVPLRLADPSEGPVLARSSIVLPRPAVPSGSLSGLHLPSFSMNLVGTASLQGAMVTTTNPGGQHVSICTCTRTGRHLATFTRRPRSSLYTLAIEAPQVAASAQVSASGPVASHCLSHLLSHQTLLRHHRLGHPSLPRLRGMHSRLLVSGLPKSLPPLPPSLAPPSLTCVEGRQCAAPHSSSFPLTTAPLQTLHMDV
ncbi:unnamed protein product, partial [Closterium sp. NIES-53]